MEIRASEIIPQIENILKIHPLFSKFSEILVKPMREDKKDEYWATSVKNYISSDGDKSVVIGTIHVNCRDIVEIGKLIEAVSHEAAHLLDDESGTLKMQIRNYLEEEINGKK